jgi:hypothetical protein
MALDQRTLDVALLVKELRELLEVKFGRGAPVEVEYDEGHDQIMILKASALFEPAEQQAMARGGAGSRRGRFTPEQVQAAMRLLRERHGLEQYALMARHRGGGETAESLLEKDGRELLRSGEARVV